MNLKGLVIMAMVMRASCPVHAAEPPLAIGAPESSGDQELVQFEIPSNPEAPPTPGDPLLLRSGPWTTKIGVFAGSQFALEDHAYWGLSDVFAPESRYNKDRVWNEAWLIPSVRVDYQLFPSLALYAGLAPAATGNIGRDLFDQGNQGEVSLENAFGGVRIGNASSTVSLD